MHNALLRTVRRHAGGGIFFSGARRSSSWAGTRSVDTARYPLHRPDSRAYAEMLAAARASLRETGCASFPQFLNCAALDEACASARSMSGDAFETDSTHNAYQLPGTDNTLPARHIRNVVMRTRVASTAYDELPRDGPLWCLYNSSEFLKLVADVVGKTEQDFYKLADPLGACSINIFRPGWFHAWHFDESEFTTTLCLQQSEEGGEFEFTPALRESQEDLVAAQVASVVNEHSPYTAEAEGTLNHQSVPITKASFEPGTLQIFAGRYSLHHVKRIPEHCKEDRLVAVLCFADKVDSYNSREVQEMFWGRSSTVRND
jgi:hypothetical protein